MRKMAFTWKFETSHAKSVVHLVIKIEAVNWTETVFYILSLMSAVLAKCFYFVIST